MTLYSSGNYGANTYGSKGIRMSFNPARNELFISKSSALTYILSDFGLSAISTEIDALAYRHGELIIHSQAAIAQSDISLRTNILNFGSLGDKRVLGVEAEIISPDDIYISVDYRENRVDAFSTTPEILLDKVRGYAKFDVKGVEFRVNFRVENYTSMKFNKAGVNYSYLDRRRRGS